LAFELPARVPSHLRRMAQEYRATNRLYHALVSSSRVRVIAETDYDTLNGGTYGHDVCLYVPFEHISQIPISRNRETAEALLNDLRLLADVPNEWIHHLRLEVAEEGDPDYQQAIAISGRPAVDESKVTAIWRQGLVRVFISHRNRYKGEAQRLADALDTFGFTCFVAHDTIPANEEWRKMIITGLETMDVMLACITDGFKQSEWTMQEIGYALGRGIPVISYKLELEDPPGFISHMQALRGNLESPTRHTNELFGLAFGGYGKQGADAGRHRYGLRPVGEFHRSDRAARRHAPHN
jgi:hypothetical protein